VAINREDGLFQVSYWRDAAGIENDPDDVEYSDFLMELKQRINQLFRERRFQHAAIFRWDDGTGNWMLVEEFEPKR
jgi:hypothetical protein